MITAEQANKISWHCLAEKDRVYLDEIYALIEHKASLGNFQLQHTITGKIDSGPQYILKQLREHGFSVGYGTDKERYRFVIEW